MAQPFDVKLPESKSCVILAEHTDHSPKARAARSTES